MSLSDKSIQASEYTNKPATYRIQKSISIDSLSSIHYFEFDDNFVDKIEAHEPWEMIYVDRGMCDVVADDEIIRLSQGEMYFHKPYERTKKRYR